MDLTCERCSHTFSSMSTLRRHRREVHRDNLAFLSPGPARTTTPEQRREAAARRDLRRRESQLLQRRLDRAEEHGRSHSLEQIVEEMERLVAVYLERLPRPTGKTSYYYLNYLVGRAGLSNLDVDVFPFGVHLQQPPAVHPKTLRRRRAQMETEVDAVSRAQQMLEQNPRLLRHFEFLFVAFCSCSAQLVE